MGEESELKFTLFDSKGRFVELQDINGLQPTQIETDTEDYETQKIKLEGGEMTFSSKISPLAMMGIFLDKTTLTKYFQSIKSNNWLKHHGLPMRRKVR